MDIPSTLFNTPPQGGAYRSYALSLLQMYLILGPLRDLVSMFAGWSLELTKLVVMHPDTIFLFDEVTNYFNMLGHLMKDRVGCDVESSHVCYG